MMQRKCLEGGLVDRVFPAPPAAARGIMQQTVPAEQGFLHEQQMKEVLFFPPSWHFPTWLLAKRSVKYTPPGTFFLLENLVKAVGVLIFIHKFPFGVLLKKKMKKKN